MGNRFLPSFHIMGGRTIRMFQLSVCCEKWVAARRNSFIWNQLLFANNRNMIRWVVLCLSHDGACTDSFENFREISLKGDLSNDITLNPPLFSLANTFKKIDLQREYSDMFNTIQVTCLLRNVALCIKEFKKKVRKQDNNWRRKWSACTVCCRKGYLLILLLSVQPGLEKQKGHNSLEGEPGQGQKNEDPDLQWTPMWRLPEVPSLRGEPIQERPEDPSFQKESVQWRSEDPSIQGEPAEWDIEASDKSQALCRSALWQSCFQRKSV